jgi:hypothetical protein
MKMGKSLSSSPFLVLQMVKSNEDAILGTLEAGVGATLHSHPHYRDLKVLTACYTSRSSV